MPAAADSTGAATAGTAAAAATACTVTVEGLMGNLIIIIMLPIKP
jgi:hypothetical protein